MRNAVLAMLLSGLAGSAAADWVRVQGDGVVTVMADPASIVRSGERVQMWSMINYAQPRATADGKAYVSSRQHLEYDCGATQSRSLFFSRHTEFTGWGDLVFKNESPGAWARVRQGTVAAALFKFACHSQ